MIRKSLVFLIFLVFVLSLAPAFAVMGEAMGNPYEEGARPTKTVASYYRVTESQVVTLAADIYNNDGYPDDVLATLQIARFAGQDPDVINRDRKQGLTWSQVLARYNVHPSRLIVPVNTASVPVLFKNAYAQYGAWKKNNKTVMNLSDRDVRYLSGLRIVANVFKQDPLEVMKSFHNKITFTWILTNGMHYTY